MLRIELKKMVQRTNFSVRNKFTMRSLSQATGIHRNILTRIANEPTAPVRSDHLEKLIMFFFEKLREEKVVAGETNHPQWERELMKSVLVDLVGLFPNEERYWKKLKRTAVASEESSQIPVSLLWSLYEESVSPVLPGDE